MQFHGDGTRPSSVQQSKLIRNCDGQVDVDCDVQGRQSTLSGRQWWWIFRYCVGRDSCSRWRRITFLTAYYYVSWRPSRHLIANGSWCRSTARSTATAQFPTGESTPPAISRQPWWMSAAFSGCHADAYPQTKAPDAIHTDRWRICWIING